MPFNAQTFRSSFKTFAQPCHYEIQFIGPPPKLPFSKSELKFFNEDMKMRVYSTQLPGLVIDTVERRYHGPTRLIPMGFAYQQIPLMIYEQKDHTVRNFFDRWMEGIHSGTDWYLRYYDDIVIPQMRLSLYASNPRLDSAGSATPIKTYIFDEVYPISVSSMQLDWSATNTLLGVNVDIQYHKWRIESTTEALSDSELNQIINDRNSRIRAN